MEKKNEDHQVVCIFYVNRKGSLMSFMFYMNTLHDYLFCGNLHFRCASVLVSFTWVHRKRFLVIYQHLFENYKCRNPNI